MCLEEFLSDGAEIAERIAAGIAAVESPTRKAAS
jgi:ABC-type amino acid transport system permease subunit